MATDETQTYTTQTENRDGDKVNGEYSYADANGALVTVKYWTYLNKVLFTFFNVCLSILD